MTMEKRPLGPKGPQLSVVALGGHEYLPDGRSRGFNEDRALATSPGHISPGYGGAARVALLRAAYELGINVFDVTMDSEKDALRRNLQEAPPPYEIHVQTRPEGMCYGYDANNQKLLDMQLLRAEVQRTLRMLGREVIDLFNIGLLDDSVRHDPDYMARLSANVMQLKQEGLIRFAVADSHSGERLYLQMLQAGVFDAVNLDLNFGDPSGLERVVPTARAAGMHVIAREAMLKGALFRIGSTIGLEDRGMLACVAMKWLGAQRPDIIIVGAENTAQLKQNVRALADPEMSAHEQAAFDMLCRCEAFREHTLVKVQRFLGLH